MRRAIEIVPAGKWAADKALTAVTLSFDERRRRRIRLLDDAGHPFLLDLARPGSMSDGDALLLESGGYLAVRAAEERVVEIRCDDPAHLARVAWHIGNRHVPVQVLEGGALRIRDDHVMVAMVEGLGARTRRLRAPFQPAPGAYARPNGDGHGHAH